MIFASFSIGLLTSTVASILVIEKIRDRKFIFEQKYDSREVSGYFYNMVSELGE
jgi:hypothetical protein